MSCEVAQMWWVKPFSLQERIWQKICAQKRAVIAVEIYIKKTIYYDVDATTCS